MPKPHVKCLIKEELAAIEKSQAWLAEKAKVEPSDLSRIIGGWRNPRVTAALRIARALGKDITTLWPDTTPKRRK